MLWCDEGLNYVKNRYAAATTGETQDDYQMIVILVPHSHSKKTIFNSSSVKCCAIKPTITWHVNESANICRERCGGNFCCHVKDIS